MKAVTRKRLGNVLLPLAAAFICVALALFPGQSLEAAREGLMLWYNNVLPSLLPFVVGVNVLTGLGAVHFLGVLLEPFMFKVFRVPGSGGFALAAGLMSGYPLGAKITSELRADNTLTADEAQRLAGFANNSGPLFIIGAVGAGMFQSVIVGYYLYAAHVLGAFAVGIAMRSYGHKKTISIPEKREARLLQRAYRSMVKARDKKSLGQVLGSGVGNAMETMLIVGGYVILFSVILKIAGVLGLFSAAEKLLSPILPGEFTATDTLNGIITGFVEVTNGVRVLSSRNAEKAALIAATAVISWGGLSIHAQSIGFLCQTEIKSSLYILCKALHAAAAATFALLLYPFYSNAAARPEQSIMVYTSFDGGSFNAAQSVFEKLMSSSMYFFRALGVIGVLAVLSIIIYAVRKAFSPRRRYGTRRI